MMGIACFNENDWEEWKQISDDQLEDEYEDWFIQASLAKSNLEKEGFIIEKVEIKPDEFKIWCNKNKKRLDGSARSQYVTELMQKGAL
ncbi:MAG: hypothetical protein V1720_07070 [bacterium]